MIWENVAFFLGIHYVYLVLLIFVIIGHAIRLHYLRTTNDKYVGNLHKIFGIIDVRHISFVAIGAPALIIGLLCFATTLNVALNDEILTDFVCTVVTRITLILSGIARFAIHVFIYIRTRIHKDQISTWWHKIGVGLISSDVLFILFTLTPFGTVDGNYANGLCSIGHNTSMAFFIWFGINDLIIGTYSLLVFVFPLVKLVKIEQKMLSANSVDTSVHHPVALIAVVRKIAIFSTLAIVTTIVSIPLTILFRNAGFLIRNGDHTLNGICVIMQFAATDVSILPSRLQCCFRWIQCQCAVKIGNHPDESKTASTNSEPKTETASTEGNKEKMTVAIHNIER